jgi:FKBP-type peptidyl-prolyl cis-trans isomerase SlyD
MKISENTVVALSYTLKENDVQGEVLEVTDEKRPLKFVYGSGMLLPDFEANIANLSEGDTFEFTLTADKSYGEVNPQAIIALSKDIFTVDGVLRADLLEIGNDIPMRNNEGMPLNGKVVSVEETTVTLDFNHPMAGKTLFFSGSINEVREATADEVMSGMPEGSGGGCGSGGCGSGGCGDGGCGSGGCGDGGCGDGGCGDGGCGSGDCGTEEKSEGSCGSGCGCH